MPTEAQQRAKYTKIEWTDRTWNPLTGCTKVSPGCDHCYAKTMHERFNGPGSFDTVTLHPERLDQPLRWRKPARVFVNSMSDLFHDDVPDEFIAQVWAVMALTPRHTYQVLTKRHARMRSLLSSPKFARTMERIFPTYVRERDDYIPLPDAPMPAADFDPACAWAGGAYDLKDALAPLPNVWLGVSVETQQWADIRIPALLDTPAAVRFLSCEPLLGPVDLHAADDGLWNHWLPDPAELDCDGAPRSEPLCQAHGVPACRQDPRCSFIDWCIVGGESGGGARPMDVEWARSLRDQCVAAGVPFLFKQWGEHYDGVRLGKKEAGRILDGRTWDEYPESVA